MTDLKKQKIENSDNTINKNIEKIVSNGLIKAFFSSPNKKKLLELSTDNELKNITKARIRMIKSNDDTLYQIETFKNNQAFHKNIPESEILNNILLIAPLFSQLVFISPDKETSLRISKKGKIHETLRMLQSTEINMPLPEHNRNKHHLLPENEPVDFLIELGIMDKTGSVRKKWYSKFKQINRYLEFIEESLEHIKKDEPHIIDFGCGKSYLTFALYYYLKKVKGLNPKITGLDLKEDVILNLKALAQKLNYGDLNFKTGNIEDYELEDSQEKKVDMVISLHACNTATDLAIAKAVEWKASVILAVPCCHKELNAQIDIKPLKSILGHSVLKERISALMTDGLRAEILKSRGYDVSILEFVDMQHTPKNLMIRGYIKKFVSADKAFINNDYKDCCKTFGLTPFLEKLLMNSTFRNGEHQNNDI